MKSKKLLTALCLFALTGCQIPGINITNNTSSTNNSTTAVSTSSESENKVSSTTNKTSSTSSTSTNTSSKVESSTSSSSNSSSSSSDENASFDSETQALFDSYFDFNVPYINLEYEIADETSTYGLPCVVIWFYDATEADFEEYLNLYAAEFTFSGETEYEGDYWYFFETEDFYMDLYYDDYSYSTSYIYVQIYDKVIADGDNGDSGSGSEYDGTPTVDGYFTESDADTLHYLLGFSVPCVGDYYEIYYYVEDFLDIMIYYNYTTMDDYNSLLTQLNSTFEYLGNEVINDVDYAIFAYEDFYLYAGYNEISREYPYILLEIYCPTYNTGSSDSGDAYYSYAEFVNGDFIEEDKAFLNETYGFVPPCVGEEYEIYDFRNEYGCVALYYYGVSASDYTSLLEAFASSFEYYGEEESDGYVYYYYICGEHYLEVVYEDSSEFVQVAIYSF